jgi:hypothetical protein
MQELQKWSESERTVDDPDLIELIREVSPASASFRNQENTWVSLGTAHLGIVALKVEMEGMISCWHVYKINK